MNVPTFPGRGAIAVMFGLIVAGPILASDEAVPKPGQSRVHGRVLDEAGQPVAGARVRLYRRENPWERRTQVVEEATAGADGGFALAAALTPPSLSGSRGLSSYSLVADHPGKAVGWRIIPRTATAFEGNVTLTSPIERTLTVVDAEKRPVKGAKVVAYTLGDHASAVPDFRDDLQFRPEDGPLTAITGAEGRATFSQLPKTDASFVATKAGFAETHAFREQSVIRLTPSAHLSGTVTGPDGAPLAGIRVVLHTNLMWDFEHAVTDAKGRYDFKDLRARGWDMSAWAPQKEGDGKHTIWLDDERFAMPTESLAFEPGSDQVMDVTAMNAGVIRVTLVEQGTDKPVAGARISGNETEQGHARRFNGYTDDQGRVTFHSAPSRISFSLVGPPDGVYIDGNRFGSGSTHKAVNFEGGAVEVTLRMPPVAGKLVTVSGRCTLPDGSPARNATVNPAAGQFNASTVTGYISSRQTDSAGRFTLEGVPSGHALHLYTETADRKFASVTTIKPSDRGLPDSPIALRLEPTVSVDIQLENSVGKPLSSMKFRLSPRVAGEEFPYIRRLVESDAKGRLKTDGIVFGLAYRLAEDTPPSRGPIMVGRDGKMPWYEEVVILAPVESK